MSGLPGRIVPVTGKARKATGKNRKARLIAGLS